MKYPGLPSNSIANWWTKSLSSLDKWLIENSIEKINEEIEEFDETGRPSWRNRGSMENVLKELEDLLKR